MRIALTPHGTRELVILTVVCALAAWGLGQLSWWLALLPAGVAIFAFSFFRDPERPLPAEAGGEKTLVSPADGTVTDVVEIAGDDFLPEPCLRVGIFLSVFNVHVNRAPMSGRIAGLKHRPGRFLDARHPQATRENEAQDILIKGDFPVVVRQIAGLIARRIVCPLAIDQPVERGQRMGMIKFGSRTELLVPMRLKPQALVKVGDTVRGTATALVRVDVAAGSGA